MADTVIVRGAGGALFEMDVPTGGNRVDLWEDKLAKGELVIVTEPVEWVEHQGAMVLRIVEPPADEPAEAAEEQEPAEPRRRGGRQPKPTEETTEVPPSEETTEVPPSEE